MAKGKAVGPAQFWSGIALTLLTIGANIWQTHAKLDAEAGRASQDAQSVVLRDLNSSIGTLLAALNSQEVMYLEQELCLERAVAPEECWERDYGWDVRATAAAWRELSSSVDYASAFLLEESQQELLETLRTIPKEHRGRLKTHLSGIGAEDSRRCRAEVSQTKKELEETYERLVAVVGAGVARV